MLYRAIVRSKFDYGYIVYGTASTTNVRQLDSVHNCGLRLALGAFCTSPVSSLYTEANEAPLEERQLKLSMHYYVKTRACTDSPAHHAMHEFDRTTRFICSQAKWKRRHDPTPSPSHWSQSRWSHDLCRHQCMQFGGTGSPQTLPIYAILFCHYACKGAVFTKLPIDPGTRNS